jgi:hypothetical protein
LDLGSRERLDSLSDRHAKVLFAMNHQQRRLPAFDETVR